MKILGIDPALTCLGWGVIHSDSPRIKYINSGLVKTNAKTPLHLRLADIATSIDAVIELYKPDLISMEETFINVNAGSSLKLGYVRGALMSVIGRSKIPFYEFAPNKIKKTIVGVGHAEKEQVKHMVQTIISGSNKEMSFDESDALAAAYTCLVTHKV
ncbi:crossover junction endodeoxyribonuclease RuvC [Rickettsiaceae bacterium]|nr:crossover junction endodeoxyribonuclease RuvC [Rickettsiaceae bacterium]